MSIDGPRAPIRRRFFGLARACHFQPTVAVVLLTTALAALNHRPWLGCIGVAAAVLAGQLSTGWSNDWFDADRDESVNRSDKPIVAGEVAVGTVRVAALIALAAAVPLSLLSGWRAAGIHLVALGSAWAYNAGLKSTLLSPVPYALSFALLPAFVTLGPPTWAWPQGGIVVATGLLGVGAHFINTLPDRQDDRETGVRGLPQRLPSSTALLIGVGLLGGCAVAIRGLGGASPTAENLLLALCLAVDLGVVIAVRADRQRTAWTLTLVSVLGCLGLFALIRPPLV